MISGNPEMEGPFRASEILSERLHKVDVSLGFFERLPYVVEAHQQQQQPAVPQQYQMPYMPPQMHQSRVEAAMRAVDDARGQM